MYKIKEYSMKINLNNQNKNINNLKKYNQNKIKVMIKFQKKNFKIINKILLFKMKWIKLNNNQIKNVNIKKNIILIIMIIL